MFRGSVICLTWTSHTFNWKSISKIKYVLVFLKRPFFYFFLKLLREIKKMWLIDRWNFEFTSIKLNIFFSNSCFEGRWTWMLKIHICFFGQKVTFPKRGIARPSSVHDSEDKVSLYSREFFINFYPTLFLSGVKKHYTHKKFTTQKTGVTLLSFSIQKIIAFAFFFCNHLVTSPRPFSDKKTN